MAWIWIYAFQPLTNHLITRRLWSQKPFIRFELGLDGLSFPCGLCSGCDLLFPPRLHQLCSFASSLLGLLPQCSVNCGSSLSCVCQTIQSLAFWILPCILLPWLCATLASGFLCPLEPFKTRSRLCVCGRRPRVSWILLVCLGLPGVNAMEPLSAAERARASAKRWGYTCAHQGLRVRRHWKAGRFCWMISEFGCTLNMA